MERVTAFAKFRRDSGLTLDAAAAKFGVDRTTILRWERGEPPVPVKRLDEIEQITGISRFDLRPDVFGSPTDRAAQSQIEGERDVA